MGNFASKRKKKGKMNHLPTDILLDTITRLPTESILEYLYCKLVCKIWRNLVSHHPSFSKMQLTRLPDLDSGKLSFIFKDDDRRLHYLEYNENHDETPPIHNSIRSMTLTLPFASSGYKVLGSLNGLVCLQEYLDYNAYICNTVTKEYVVLPIIKIDCHGQGYSCWTSGFGYDSVTNEYKVVAFFQLRVDVYFMEAVVYTLGSGHGWRKVGWSDIIFSVHGVFANGTLHWMDRNGRRVLAFDLTKEKFEHLPLPPLPSTSTWVRLMMRVFGEDLCCTIRYHCQITGCTRFDIWLSRKKNDIPDRKGEMENEPLGWRKESTVYEDEPLAFTKGGGVLCFDDRTLGIYDPVALTFKELEIF